MKIEAESVLRLSAPAGGAWRTALPVLAAMLAAIVAMYWRTAASIVAIWDRSETFAHGYLIVPIVLVLVWAKRRELAAIAPRPDYLGFAALAGAGLAWLVAAAGDVQVVQQYAMAAMIPAAVLAVAGRQVARTIAFPLAFLLLGVPVGEFLIPPLMEWTADFTVTALQLSGIPVYREGLFFTIPSGQWSVVEGCSGLRYLIASVTVGVLFAYLNYTRPWKRALFVLAAVLVPIVANGLRAYGIVMIAHLSDMKLAMGVDHFVYGWVFFGIVMLLLFWIGSFWRDAAPRPSTAAKPAPARPAASARRLAAAALAAVALAGTWPAYGAYLDQPSGRAAHLAVPAPAAGWEIDAAALTDWRPRYRGSAASLFQVYRKGERRVGLYLAHYRDQRQGAQLITSQNLMVVQKHPVWINVGEGRRAEDLGGGEVQIRQTRLRSPEQRLLVWDWFRIAGRDLSNPYLGKLYLARDRLLARGDDAGAIIVATPYDELAEPAQETLRLFTREMRPSIEAALAGSMAGEAR